MRIPKKLTVLEVLAIGIKSEIDTQVLYEEMAARVESPAARERFLGLAAEEKKHQMLLEREHHALFPHVELRLPPSLLPPHAASPELRKTLSIRELLTIAVHEERHSRDFYLEAMRYIEDPGGKAMLHFLADWEYAHQTALSAEYDMLVKYPHYYEDIAEPWQEEDVDHQKQ
ncbi:MAG: ferritin family protein [Ignavibacteria bacterium]|nr:ferritin family protein [Ignavibacteria bacterium]